MLDITGAVKNYAWGGNCYIPMFLSDAPKENTTYAEIWYGAHKAGASKIVNGSLLNEFIEKNPIKTLGNEVAKAYSEQLPYLLKVLDVREPLSIQVHPTKDQAKQGFDRELKENIDAALRNYKDDNHKPELMLALSDFYLLHGFAKIEESIKQLQRFDSLKAFAKELQEKGLKDFVNSIFLKAKTEFIPLFEPILEKYTKAYLNYEISKMDPLFWFIRAALVSKEHNLPLDAGLIMIFIMNLMYVPKGKVVYQGAGVPHAYLEGENIELMANSDNVVRGGLTPKHVDVRELLKITEFKEITPQYVQAVQTEDGGLEYNVPVKDFVLREYNLKAGASFVTPKDNGPCIWLLFSGELKLNGREYNSGKGRAFFQEPGEVASLVANSDVTLFRASCNV